MDSCTRREQFEYLWVRHGLLMTKYNRLSEHLSILWQSLKVLHFLVRFLPDCPKYLVLYSGEIVSAYILTDARNALSLLAFACMSYTMPSGENEENKAYSRWIFFNLRPNEIAQIIEPLQKGTFVPTMGANVYKQHNLTNFLQKEVPMGSETCLKNSNE